MKVLIIWDADYPWDIRIEKFCNSFIEVGIEVHLVCRNKAQKDRKEVFQGVHIHRISSLPKIFGKLNYAYGFPAFFSPVWLKEIWSVAEAQKVDLIIVRDLPMALAAICIGSIRRIPTVMDMAECYPELLKVIWRFERFKIQNILVRNPVMANIIEKIALKNIDHIFVMVEESKARLIEKGVNADKITIVSNTPVYERFETAKPTFPGILSLHRGKLILIYVGLLNHSRGVDNILRSLKKLIEINENVFLVLLGSGNAERELKEMTRRLKLERYVGFEGWINNSIVPEYISSADICVVPHRKCSHWDNTIPNKLFDYMASGKPVVTSNATPMKRIVESSQCGLIYEDGDISNLTTQLIRLQSAELRRALGQNGVRAIREKYNWRADSVEMLHAAHNLVKA